MPRKRDSNYSYQMTSVDVRSDLLFLKRERKWNLREVLEVALLSMVTEEDLAYAESNRLEKELDRQKKILEQSEKKELKI